MFSFIIVIVIIISIIITIIIIIRLSPYPVNTDHMHMSVETSATYHVILPLADWGLWSLSLTHAEILTGLIYTDLVQVTIVDMSSCVQQSCHAQMTAPSSSS